MYLKKLEMQGFKSFPDKIRLDFTSGLTVIVGPNGSGKSNITDAVRWVLGEQSAKMLRGAKMEDVIFSGTDARKPLGFAEVSVTFDNSDKRLNIEYDEVTVTRRVYRSGDGEYFINRASVRLRDVHELFMDTGLGRDGYSLIGQGKIDEILSNKSEDRRRVFEEAAGISKYKYRKIEAQRKLDGTTANLERISDITGELESRLAPLLRQSEKAKRFLELSDRLKKLEATVSIENLDSLKRALAELDVSLRGLNISTEECGAALESLEKEIGALYESIGTTEAEIAGVREDITSFEGSIKLHRSEIETCRATIEDNKAEIEKLETEVSESSAEAADRLSETENKTKEVEALKLSVLAYAAQLSALEKKQLENQKLRDAALAELSGANEALSLSSAETAEIRAALSGADALSENYRAQMVGAENTAAESEAKIAELKAAAKKLSEEANAKERLKHDFIIKKEKINSEISELEKKCGSDGQMLSDKLSLLNMKYDRIKMLTELENEYEGYQKGVKSVMQAAGSALKNADIHAPLSRLITVEKEYTAAIEAALGGALQNIVTGTEEDAKAAIAYLKKTRGGRVTFLPLTSVKPRKFDEDLSGFDGFLGLASELCGYDKAYKNIVSSLLGAAAVTDNIDNAVKMAKKCSYRFKIVTLEGEIISPGGSITGGNSGRSNGILTRAGDKQQLIEECEKLSAAADRLKSKNAETQKILDEKNFLLSETEDNIRQTDADIMALAAEDNRINYEITRESGEAEKNRELAKSAKARIDEIETQTADRRKRLCELTAETKKFGEASEELKRKYEIAAENERKSAEEVSAAKTEALNAEKAAAVEGERINSLKIAYSAAMSRASAAKEKCEALRLKNNALSSEIEIKLKKIDALNGEIEQKRARMSEIEERKQARGEEINAKQAAVKQERERFSAIQTEISKLETRKNKGEMEQDAIVNKLWDDYGLTYITAAEFKCEIESVPAAKTEISGIKRQISALGSINVDAIEEYKSVKERYEFLSGQKNDLVEAKSALEKTIADMQDLMKTVFSEQFKIINAHFAETFRLLFGGGKAELKLSDPSDVLESGIDIDVQPPGKRLQNLMLLSGGEKALCAIAIIFAILKTRPAPFCIFDEIEAALDDVNVYRFAEYLKIMNENTQFMVVTHRRGTMEAADKLYGVTMPKKGISEMLELDISELDKKIKLN